MSAAHESIFFKSSAALEDRVMLACSLPNKTLSGS